MSEATLTITIVGASGDPSITPDEPDPEVPGDPDKPVDPDDPKTQGALITVHEKNLADGTAPDAAKLTVEGTMEIDAPDGVKSLNVGDLEIALDGTATTLNIGENVLTLSYSASSGTAGTLSYSFTLTDELSHKDGESLLEELLSKYQITLTDLEGKTARSALHVKVMDDAPEMELDEDIELESGDEVDVEFSFTVGADNGDGQKLVVTFKKEDGSFVTDSEGNVLTVEIDDPNSAWEIKGQFGTLKRHEDGTYTYKADPFDEDALGETLDGDEFTLPDQVKDIFTFTLIDANGDSTGPDDWTATISKPEYGGDTEVPEALKRPLLAWEADLVDGNPVYEITVPEGYEIIDVYGDPKHGEIYEEDGKWFYKLTVSIDSGDIQGSNHVKNGDSFTIWVERIEDGADFEVNVPVTIVDDVPEFGEDVIFAYQAHDSMFWAETGPFILSKNHVVLNMGDLEIESFGMADGSMKSIRRDDGKFILEVDETADHPAGSFVIEHLEENVWAGSFLQENGAQQEADWRLMVMDRSGSSHEIGFSTGIAYRFECDIYKDGKWEAVDIVPEISDGKFIYDLDEDDPAYRSGPASFTECGMYISVYDSSSQEITYWDSSNQNHDGCLKAIKNGGSGFFVSFGADGPADLPFTIEDGIEPVSAEDDTYTFEIRDHDSIPDGQIVIQKAGENWQYSFIAENGNLNYDFELKLNAIDADGDVASRTLHFVKHDAPVIEYESEYPFIEVDEGDQPWHMDKPAWAHENSGQKAFTVNLHGDDGTISFGDMTIAIENRVATADKASFTTVNGIVIALGEMACDENGIWTINYGYSHNGEAQQHDRVNPDEYSNDDIIGNDIAITVTSANGKSVSNSIWGAVHDDIPVFGEVEAYNTFSVSDPWPLFANRPFVSAASIIDEEPEYVEDGWGKLVTNASRSGFISFSHQIGLRMSFGSESTEILQDAENHIQLDGGAELTLKHISGNAWYYEVVGEVYVAMRKSYPVTFSTADGVNAEITFDCMLGGEDNREVLLKDVSGKMISHYHEAYYEDAEGNSHEAYFRYVDGIPWSTQPEEDVVAKTFDDLCLVLLNDISAASGIDFIGGIDSDSLTGSFTVSFGADGMADIPFRIDGSDPAASEDNRWTYDLDATDSHPAGQFIIAQTEAGFAYEFVPADTNLNFDASQIKISAIDGDGDVAESAVTVSRHLPVSIMDKSGDELAVGAAASEFAIDEGDRPEHCGDEAHAAGQESFIVNLHGQDGRIDVSGLVITIENGEASFDPEAKATVNGAELSIVSAQLNAEGRWDIGYSYRYADEAGQKHDAGIDALSGELSIMVTGADGQKATGSITAIIHDDVPEIWSSSHEVAAGQKLTGEISHDFGADADGKLVLVVDGEEKEIGEDGLELAGEHGILKISSDGKWTYQANAGSEGTDSFDLRVIDGDADIADASLSLEIWDRPYFSEMEVKVTSIERNFAEWFMAP